MKPLKNIHYTDPSSDSVEELVAAATRKPVGDVKSALANVGGLRGVACAPALVLRESFGVGPATSAQLAAAFELGRRAHREQITTPIHAASSAEDVVRWARIKGLDVLDHEELWMLVLDARNRVAGERLVARGGIHACAATARDVLRIALVAGASAFALIHNHPGGNACPSIEDLRYTKQVTDACLAVGLQFVDHVVIAPCESTSMLADGFFDQLSEVQ